MGLFSRKQSKSAVAPKSTTDSSSLQSNGSLKGSVQAPKKNSLSKPTIPDIPIPRAPDPQTNPAAYLRSIHAVRDRSKIVLEKAKKNQLKHFTVDMTKFPDTASYVVSIIKVRSRLARQLRLARVPLTVLSSGSETMPPISLRFLHTEDGSTSTSAVDPVSISSWPPGRPPSTIRNGAGV